MSVCMGNGLIVLLTERKVAVAAVWVGREMHPLRAAVCEGGCV